MDRSQDFGKVPAKYYRIIAQCFNNAAELARSCTMPRDASFTTRVVYTCSRENFRFNEDYEMLHPADMIDPLKAWRDVIKYMLPFCQVREKIEAAEKKFPAFSAWFMDQALIAMDASKQCGRNKIQDSTNRQHSGTCSQTSSFQNASSRHREVSVPTFHRRVGSRILGLHHFSQDRPSRATAYWRILSLWRFAWRSHRYDCGVETDFKIV